jgi:hypothetical protein
VGRSHGGSGSNWPAWNSCDSKSQNHETKHTRPKGSEDPFFQRLETRSKQRKLQKHDRQTSSVCVCVCVRSFIPSPPQWMGKLAWSVCVCVCVCGGGGHPTLGALLNQETITRFSLLDWTENSQFELLLAFCWQIPKLSLPEQNTAICVACVKVPGFFGARLNSQSEIKCNFDFLCGRISNWMDLWKKT